MLAVSAKHQSIVNAHPEHEASFYHGQCLRLTIDALSESETYDDELVASVVLLRVYEEFEPSNNTYMHDYGISRLLAAIPTFAHSGGLAEAACWQYLRQSIVVSLQTRQRPTFQLEYYDHSSASRFQDDGACANVIVLLFAKLLRLANSPGESPDEWHALDTSVEKWNDRRKRLFQPVFEQQAGVDGRPFPVICMTNLPQGMFSAHS